MRRIALAVGLVLGSLASCPGAQAAEAGPPPAASSTLAPLPAPPPPAVAATGLAVIALAGAADAAWPLAQSVYATPSLRPAALEEARARVLCGEPPVAGSPSELRDLAETVAAIHGDDAPSRAILGELAHRLSVRGIVVVRVDGGRPSARVFLADSGTFDAATYASDDAVAPAWAAATRSLARTFGNEPATVAPSPAHAPPLATHEEPLVDNAPPKKRAFYESGWFWGAIGAAAFAGGAVFFATRDNGASTIHLQAQVPH